MVDITNTKSPYPYQQPTNYYLDYEQRQMNLMHIIFNDFLALPMSKKPLNAYFIRELIFWAAQSPQFKIKHHYLYKQPPKEFKISYNKQMVYRQMIRNHKLQIQQQLTTNTNSSTPSMVHNNSDDDDDDIIMNEQS